MSFNGSSDFIESEYGFGQEGSNGSHFGSNPFRDGTPLPRPEEVRPKSRQQERLSARLYGAAGVKGTNMLEHTGQVDPRDCSLVPRLDLANKLRERVVLTPRLNSSIIPASARIQPTPPATGSSIMGAPNSARTIRSNKGEMLPVRPLPRTFNRSLGGAVRPLPKTRKLEKNGGWTRPSSGEDARSTGTRTTGPDATDGGHSTTEEAGRAKLSFKQRQEEEKQSRSALLQKAHTFRTFMESLEEDEKFQQQLAYGYSFMYLQPGSDNPYNLRVVDHASVDPSDYYTLSEAGVTRFTAGAGAEFMFLDQFEREYYLYSMVTQLPFFRKYRAWKAFSEWKKSVRARKRLQRRRCLQADLFILQPLLRDGLMALRDMCYKVSVFKLYHIDPKSTYTLEEFCARQASQRVEITKRLQKFSDEVSDLVQTACEAALRDFLEENGFGSGDEDEVMGGGQGIGSSMAGGTGGWGDTMGGDDYDDAGEGLREITFTERAAMRTQCRKLTKYVRLADFFVVDAFLSLAVGSTEDFLRSIQSATDSCGGMALMGGGGGNGGGGKMLSKDTSALASSSSSAGGGGGDGASPLFRVEMQVTFLEQDELETDGGGGGADASGSSAAEMAAFALHAAAGGLEADAKADGGAGGGVVGGTAAVLEFRPKVDEFKVQVESVIYDALKVVTSPARLLTAPAFETFVWPSVDEHGPLGEGVDLEMMVVEDAYFQSMVDAIHACLGDAFLAAEEYAECFKPFQMKFLANRKFLRTCTLELYRDLELDDLRRLLIAYMQQEDEFAAIPNGNDVAIIRVDSRELNRIFQPSPGACLAALHALVPAIYQEKNSDLLGELSSLHEAISAVPYSVDDFVALMKRLVDTSEKMIHLDNRVFFLTEMFSMMEEYAIHVSDVHKSANFLLTQTASQLKTSVSLSEESIEDSSARFAKELDASIPRLREQVTECAESLGHPMILSPDSDAIEVIAFLEDVQTKVTDLVTTADKYTAYQEMLKVPIASFEELDGVVSDLKLKLRVWNGLEGWAALTSQWHTTPLNKIDAESVEKEIQVYYKTVVQAEKALGGGPGGAVVAKLKQMVQEFKLTMPVVVDLRCAALRDRHWEAVHEAVGFVIRHTPRATEGEDGDAGEEESEDGMTLGRLIELRAMDAAEAVATIAQQAVQEAVLVEMCEKVASVWTELEFEVVPHRDGKEKDVYVLGSVDEIAAQLDDSLVTINTILGSRFVGPIRGDVEEWLRRLVTFQETLDEWTQCQRNWMYLESIFGAPDIQRQLPAESKLFAAVDTSWKYVMKRTQETPNCIQAGTVAGLCELFEKHNASLDRIQKSLEDYLELKRVAFPRFYFLSNDELLEILAQTKEPQAVQPHLRKCFDGLVRLEFGDGASSTDILAMMSGEGERVALGRNLKARGPVEEWLGGVEEDMRRSLRKLMKAALLDYDATSRRNWVLAHPAQCVAAIAQVAWARGCEEAITAANPNPALSDWYMVQLKQLAELTQLVRGQLSSLQRAVIVALVTTDVHARDIVETLRAGNVSNVNNFSWQQQLRYGWDMATDDVRVRQSNSGIPYGYEYMGATSRLVITPLTDRCWMTITGSFDLKLGASPAGPAGTGKTESSKDLAKALAIQCIVFNCSDQIDYKMMGKLFSGLAQCGVWTCLDEFNRIDIEVLSVIAQQLTSLRGARLAHQTEVNFEGRTVRLKDHHVIVTMNPGYAGRTALPDNLKVCFRPVAMMVPDYALIAEIMLFAEGFEGAKALSRKMTKLYKLSSEQLSQQPHYDFGMRAVKSVLVMAGALKRSEAALGEDVVLIRAMRDANVPKFLSDDLPLFAAIVQDLFPGVEVPVNEYEELEGAIVAALQEEGLQPVPSFMAKVVELFETFNVRFGVALVGPTGGGKSCCYRALQRACTLLREAESPDERFQHVECNVLNPKAISLGELYGEFNPLTQEWRDGLASTLLRAAVNDPSPDDKKWTMFDGPIDALWIENMNTVLDDNVTLCLANGERVKLRSHQMRMLFEVADLAVASPATVSRLGVVYVTSSTLGWMPLIESWLPTALPDGAHPEALAQLEACIPLIQPAFDYLYNDCGEKEPIPSCAINMAASLTALFSSLIKEYNLAEMSIEEQCGSIDSVFAFALAWSVGGSCVPARAQFDTVLRDLLEAHDRQVDLPSGALTIFDFALSGRTFTPWSEQVPAFQYGGEGAAQFFNLLVPTVDTVRTSFVLTLLLRRMKPAFLTGLTGTGKTVVMQALLAKLAPPASENTGGLGVVPLEINFSAQTSSSVTQNTIESKLEKKRKNLLGAGSGGRVVLLVDDVNMPRVEQYGAQPPLELLRQLLDFGGFYDRQKLFWKTVQDTVLFVSAAPPGGGRNPVSPRFTRHFNLLCMPTPEASTLTIIFSSILSAFLLDFPSEVRTLGRPIVASTVEVFARCRTELLPTPAKSHYTFNLRDVAKVFQGLLMVRPRQCQSSEVMSRLWVHESMRVFHDRLVNDEDKLWFTELLCELLQNNFKLTSSHWTHAALFESGSHPIMFGDFLKPGAAPEDRVYEECPNVGRVALLLDDYLEEYNLTHASTMNLVFFEDAIKHACRISRILRQPRGHAMLVGVGGSGKQSLTRLAAGMAEYQCFQIEMTKSYGAVEFREDLRNLMVSAGVAGNNTAFLFTDSQILMEGFVEDINNLLNSGEVPNLFPPDEYEKVMADMRPVVKEMGLPESRTECRKQFVLRVRARLHVVLCMSPVGDALRLRCRSFPSLIDCTTIDWFSAWPEEALHSVAERFLAEVAMPSEEVRTGVVDMCVDVHRSLHAMEEAFWHERGRRTYTTPKSYLDLLMLYVSALAEKRDVLGRARNRLSVGVVKLEDSNAMVEGLKGELTALQPVLKEKAEEAEVLLKRVAVDQEEAKQVAERVGADEAEVKLQATEVSAVQADAQRDLDKALPALDASIRALDSLDKKDITEVRSFKQPPAAVQTVMEAVCILLGEKPDWDTAKKVLLRATFLEELKGYDKDNIPHKVLTKLKRYVEDPGMAVEVVRKTSAAATSMCMWVHAMDVYSRVAKEVGPKKARLDEMNAILAEANGRLAEKQQELRAVVSRVQALQRECDATLAEKNRLAMEAERTRNRLLRAEKLTVGLADELERWKATVAASNVRIAALVGDVFLAAAAISYYGAFTGPYRASLVEGWVEGAKSRGVPCSDEFSLQQVMGEPVQIREWQVSGLPTDAVSTDSAILVTRGKRWPLMIDPQGQANKWIKATEAKAKLEVVKMSAQNSPLLRRLETCIRMGRPLLLEDVGETLEPSLEPVLLKQTYKQGGRLLIRLGDSDVDYDQGFRLYLTSKLPNPHYLPEVCIKVTLINFTVTDTGLTEQLLGEVVKRERPDIEERKNLLVMSIAADKRQLKGIEDKILRLLGESTGNILDDELLISTLAESKITSNVISERLAESETTEIEINATRDAYRDVAERGSILYFVVAELANVDPMYQYSLEYFVSLFVGCIVNCEQSDVLAVRLELLLEHLTQDIFSNVCRGLFERHKLLFACLITGQIELRAGRVSSHEWLLLLRGAGLGVDRSGQPTNPSPERLSASQWDTLCDMSETMESCTGLASHLSEVWDMWEPIMTSEKPQTLPLPDPFDMQLSPFQRLLLFKTLREEKGVFAVSEWIEGLLGRQFVAPPVVSMRDLYSDISASIPCVFVLSTGADPTSILLRFAGEQGMAERLHLISLGQGQGPRAEALMEASAKNGDWVLLQNCHLAKSWMPDLERIVFELSQQPDITDGAGGGGGGEGGGPPAQSGGDGGNTIRSVHPDFRLFLTSFPAPYFPVPVLQCSVKLTNEPPQGLRANILRSFDIQVSEDMWDSCSSRPQTWHRLLFSLAFFHGIVQERRKFGPLGWNIRYEFNDSDLETAASVLRRFLDDLGEDSGEVPWDALQYVTGHINYGGRVTDDWDRRCLLAALCIAYTPKVLESGNGYAYSSSGLYAPPEADELSNVREYIKQLPASDHPEVFGLHSNADISFQQQQSAALLDAVLRLQPRTGGAGEGEKSADETVTEVANDILEGLPAQLNVKDAYPGTFEPNSLGVIDSLSVVLGQEMVKFNRLLEVVRATLTQLQAAIKGLVVMSSELDQTYGQLLVNRVPTSWEQVGFASLKPLGSWVVDLRERIAFLHGWLTRNKPHAFPLPVFFFPQGFLTGVLQNHARKYKIPINRLDFKFKVLAPDYLQLQGGDDKNSGEHKVSEDGVVVYGLYMEGARWCSKKGEVEESRPGETYAPMPPLHFLPEADHVADPSNYQCPTYKTSVRQGVLSTTGISTNFVLPVELPSSKPPDHWVLMGVACLCNLND